MTDWSRIQRIELELAQAHGRNMRLTEERDTARRVAVRLESELAARDAGIVMVPLVGEAT